MKTIETEQGFEHKNERFLVIFSFSTEYDLSRMSFREFFLLEGNINRLTNKVYSLKILLLIVYFSIS